MSSTTARHTRFAKPPAVPQQSIVRDMVTYAVVGVGLSVFSSERVVAVLIGTKWSSWVAGSATFTATLFLLLALLSGVTLLKRAFGSSGPLYDDSSNQRRSRDVRAKTSRRGELLTEAVSSDLARGATVSEKAITSPTHRAAQSIRASAVSPTSYGYSSDERLVGRSSPLSDDQRWFLHKSMSAQHSPSPSSSSVRSTGSGSVGALSPSSSSLLGSSMGGSRGDVGPSYTSPYRSPYASPSMSFRGSPSGAGALSPTSPVGTMGGVVSGAGARLDAARTYRTAARTPTKGGPVKSASHSQYTQLLERLHIQHNFVEQASERLRAWLSVSVFRRLVRMMDEFEKSGDPLVAINKSPTELLHQREQRRLAQAQASQAAQKKVAFGGTSSTFGSGVKKTGFSFGKSTFGSTAGKTGTTSTSTSTFGQKKPEQNTQVLSRSLLDQACDERLMLEQYFELHFPGEKARGYLIQRIRTLAKGLYMSEYKWNSGGSWRGAKWSPELPTDAQIVMHLFCTYLDHWMPLHEHSTRPFSSRHYVAYPKKPGSIKHHDVLLYQTQTQNPHFVVVHRPRGGDGPDEKWSTEPGPHNLFHAIVLFLLCVESELGGHVGTLNLTGSAALGLGEVIQR